MFIFYLDIGRNDDHFVSDEESKTHAKKTKEELRALWKKAIIEQILLIRMEKENKKLQGVYTLKRYSFVLIFKFTIKNSFILFL